MDQFIRMVFVFPMHFLVFLSMGTLLALALHQKDWSLPGAVLSGYFVYFALFQVICVPAKFLGVTTRGLSALMLVLMGTAIAAAAVLGGRHWLGELSGAAGRAKRHGWMALAVTAAVLIQCVIVVFYVDGSQDAAYYVGVANTAVYTDTLERFNVYTGAAKKVFNARYVFSAFPFHNAVVSVLTRLSVIIQARTVIPAVNVCIANLIVYRIGRQLFRGKDVRWADLFVLLVFGINLFANTLFLPGAFYFCRLYEGKAMVANIALPMVLLCALSLWSKEEGEKLTWIQLFACCLSAISFSGSGFITAIMAAVCLLPVCLHRRSAKCLLLSAFSVTPVILWGILYALAKLGILSLAIN